MRTSISLFSGIGGLDEGLHQVGFAPVFCCEVDENAYRTLTNWCEIRKISPLLVKDINNICPQNLKKNLGMEDNDLDLLSGGPPCQSFSLIGSKKSLNDERGLLLLKMVEFARVFKPKAILIEQVKGLLSAKGHDGKSGSVFNDIVVDLQKIGYSVSYRILRAADYGVAQLRDRVFIVGLYGEKTFEFPCPTHCDTSKQPEQLSRIDKKLPYLTLKDVMYDLPSPTLKGWEELFPNHVDITPARDKERINGVPEGECLARQLFLPASQRKSLNPEKDTTKFRRISWGKPSLTLRGGEAFYHPTENRYLTPRECMRIHGFNDDHILLGPIRGRSGSVTSLDQHRMVANSVPPPLAFAIGSAIYSHLG
jgi:DNA (cytosine-5)-methyltransferase 1